MTDKKSNRKRRGETSVLLIEKISLRGLPHTVNLQVDIMVSFQETRTVNLCSKSYDLPDQKSTDIVGHDLCDISYTNKTVTVTNPGPYLPDNTA